MNYRKHLICFLLACLVFAVPAWSETADMVWVEGYVDIKDREGEIFEAVIGDLVQTGDSVITGKDGTAQLEKSDQATITVKPDTVFVLMEREVEGEKRTVLSTVLGAVKFRFGRLFGTEPVIATPSAVAGVRGTEFEVYAGADGSSLIAVESGLVVVESEGESVELNPDEGVEVRPGEVPGEKFVVLRGQLDFSEWNRSREEDFARDPVGSLKRAAAGLTSIVNKLEEAVPLYETSRRKLDSLRDELDTMDAEKQKEERKKLYTESVYPLEVETSYRYLNVRYFALSSLSYRRFVLGRMYVYMKSYYAVDRDNPVYVEFMRQYANTLDMFEKEVSPYLVDADV